MDQHIDDIPRPSNNNTGETSPRHGLLSSSGKFTNALRSGIMAGQTKVQKAIQKSRQPQQQGSNTTAPSVFVTDETTTTSQWDGASVFEHDDVPGSGEPLSVPVPSPPEEEEAARTIPIEFDKAAQIEGTESQIITVTLRPNQLLRAEINSFIYMTANVKMTANNNNSSSGGFSAGLQRMMVVGGNHSPIVNYTNIDEDPDATGSVVLGSSTPCKIIKVNLDDHGGKVICQKGTFLCSADSVVVQKEVPKNVKTGLFGGEGVGLQSLTGFGEVFLKSSGLVIERQLGEHEKIRISSGSLVAYSSEVNYDVETARTFANIVGSSGVLVGTLSGPGKVWLQGMPFHRMAGDAGRDKI